MSMGSELSSKEKDSADKRPRILSFDPAESPQDSYEFHFSNCTVHLEIADRAEQRKTNKSKRSRALSDHEDTESKEDVYYRRISAKEPKQRRADAARSPTQLLYFGLNK